MSWIQTYAGRKVYPLWLRQEDVSLVDIAHSLAMQCRFTGHTREFYSVAQHSVLVSLYCDPKDALWGLLHDASEAYLIDVPRPVKRTKEMGFYREAEANAMATICSVFKLDPEMPSSVHEADQRMLTTEARDLMSPLHPHWPVNGSHPYRRRIHPWSPRQAKEAFIDRFIRIQQKSLADLETDHQEMTA